jgi:hypothetical protein
LGDFVVTPQADASRVQMQFDGVEQITLNSAGDLLVKTASQALRFRKPSIYQFFGSEKHSIPGGFKLNQQRVVFWVGAYDKTHALIIDPVLVYSTFFAGTVSALALDSVGNIYIAGRSTAGVPLQSPYQNNPGGNVAAFLTKFDPTAQQLIFSTYFSGSRDDAAIGMALDAAGNAYITGNSLSPDIPTTNGAFMRQCPGLCNTPFVAKFDPAGALQYSTYTGGSNATARAGRR